MFNQKKKTQRKTISASHAGTPSCQMTTSDWRQRCMKSELASLLHVAMATAAFGKSPPTRGNSQVSPGNQNGLFSLGGNLKRAVWASAGLLRGTPGLTNSCQAWQGWMRIRVCCITRRCRSRLSRLFPEAGSIGPSSPDIGSCLLQPCWFILSSLQLTSEFFLVVDIFLGCLTRYWRQVR